MNALIPLRKLFSRRWRCTLSLAIVLAVLAHIVPLAPPSPSQTVIALLSEAPAPVDLAAPYLSRAVLPFDAAASWLSTAPRIAHAAAVTLTLTKSDSPDPVPQGDDITYLLSVTNMASITTTNLVVSDTVPGNTTFVSAGFWPPYSGGVFAPPISGTGTVRWEPSTQLGPGQMMQLDLKVRVNKPVPEATLINNDTYQAKADNSDLAVGSTVTTTVSAPALAVGKAADPSPVCAGTWLTYTLYVTNTGTLTATQPYVVSDTVPANTAFVAASSPGVYGDGVVSWTLGTPLAPQQLISVTFTVSNPLANGEGTAIVNRSYWVSSTEVPAVVYGSPLTATSSMVTAAFTTTSPVCLGGAIDFGNASTGAASYLWSFGDGVTSTMTSPSHTYGGAGTYTVWLTATSGLGCGLDVTSATVTVNPRPVADFTTNSPVCLGQTTTFSNTGSGYSSVWWDFGDGRTSSLISPTNVYTSAGNFVVTLSVTSTEGCTDLITHTVTVNSVPSPVLDIAPNPAAVSSTVWFTDTGSGATGWQWNFGDGVITTTTVDRAQHSYSSQGAFAVVLTATNASGCISTTQGLIQVGIPATVTLTATPTLLTVGQTALLTATVRDQSGTLLSGQVIAFSASGLGSGGIVPPSDATDASGQAHSTISSTLPGAKLVTATATNGVTGTTTITWVVGPPRSVFATAYPSSIVADGSSISEVRATVSDLYNNPVADGTVVTFVTSLGSLPADPYTRTTSGGVATATLTSAPVAGQAWITATADSYWDVTTVDFVSSTLCADAYETDDDWSQASEIVVSGQQQHTFGAPGDFDWVKFQALTGYTYTIATGDLTGGADTILDLYGPVSGTTWIAKDDDSGPGLASLIAWPAPAAGTYYVRVRDWDPARGGCNISFTLSITTTFDTYLPVILKGYPESPTPTPTPTDTPTATSTSTSTSTPTPTDTPTSTSTPTPTEGPTPTSTPTPTEGPTPECYPTVPGVASVQNLPHGVEVDETANRVFVANYGSDSVSIINGFTNAVMDTITGVAGPKGVAYRPTGDFLYVGNYDAGTVTRIRVSDKVVTGTIAVGGGPLGVAYNPTADKVYVANTLSNTVSVIDASTNAVVATVTATVVSEPRYIAVNPVTDRVYVSFAEGDDRRVVVVDGNTDAVLMRIPTYSGELAGITVDADRNYVYVVSPATHHVVSIDANRATAEEMYRGWAEIFVGGQSVPLYMAAVNPQFGAAGHLFVTSAGGVDKAIVLKGYEDWAEIGGLYAVAVGDESREGIDVNYTTDRVYISSLNPNDVTALWDGWPECYMPLAEEVTAEVCLVGVHGDCR